MIRLQIRPITRTGRPGKACRQGVRHAVGCILAWTLFHVQADAATQVPPAAPDEAGRTHPAPGPATGRAPELTVALLGGSLQDAQQAALFTPFSKQSLVRVRIVAWDGRAATLQGRAQTANNAWDLVLMEAAPLQLACRQGLLLPHPLIADPADTAPDSSGADCGVGELHINLVLAWDRGRVDMIPTWADFWDVARRPGKRGLQRDPRGTLEIALMADGVAPDDVYRTLASSEGVDRAFRKLDQLKPYIVWWNTPSEAVQIIESGAVLMTSAPDGEVAAADRIGHRSFGMQWVQSLGLTLGWAMPRAIPPDRHALTQRLLDYLVDPAHQAEFLAAYPAASGSQAATAGGARHPTLMTDDLFWVEHLVPLRRRFDAWLVAR